MDTQTLWKTKFLIITVLVVFVQASRGQAYVRAYYNQQQFYTQDSVSPEPTYRNYTSEQEGNNSTVIIFETTVNEKPNELSQSAMDIITIIWYVATFLALAAFFMLMACSERRCSQARLAANAGNNNDNTAAPPTPSPSYSNFAPPSYDTVMKTQEAHKTSIFVIPFTHPNGQKDDSVNSSQPNTPTPVTFYTIDELQKFSS